MADSPARGKKRFYITNEVLLPEVKRAKELGRITNELGKMFILITERFSRHPSFSGYSFRDDMIAFALTNLCANGLKFDVEKYDNPFNYYTTAIYHSFLQYLAEEKKQRNIRDTLLVELGANPSSTFLQNAHDDYVDDHREDGSDYASRKKESEDGPKRSRNQGLGGRKKPIKSKTLQEKEELKKSKE